MASCLRSPAHAAPVNWTGTIGYRHWNPGLPAAIDDVTINVPGVQTVTVRQGTNTVGSLNITGDEILAVTGGTLTLTFASHLATYNQSGGTLSGTGSVVTSGPATWTGGSMTGTGSTNANGGLAISGSSVKDLTVRTLASSGTTTWSNTAAGNGNIRTGSGAAINNSGTWLDQNVFNSSISNDFGGPQSNFNNTGTYTKSGNSTTTIGIGFNNIRVLPVQEIWQVWRPVRPTVQV